MGVVDLNPSFHGQLRVLPVLKGGKGFQTFKHSFILKANMQDISDYFVGQRVQALPVGDPLGRKLCCCERGFYLRE